MCVRLLQVFSFLVLSAILADSLCIIVLKLSNIDVIIRSFHILFSWKSLFVQHFICCILYLIHCTSVLQLIEQLSEI